MDRQLEHAADQPDYYCRVVTTFANTVSTPTSIAAGRGHGWYTNWASQSIGRMTRKGASNSFTAPGVVYPQNITLGSGGAMWFTNGGVAYSGYSIGRITKSGTVSIYPPAD